MLHAGTDKHFSERIKVVLAQHSLNSVASRKWLIVFTAAVVLRGLLFLHIMDKPQVIFQPDSQMYTGLAEGIRQHGVLCYPDRPGEPDMERLPGYPAFLAAILFLTGGSFLAVVGLQALMDSISCVLVGILGERVWRGAGLLCGLLAAVNVNMITYSFFVLNDSLFLFLFLLAIITVFKLMDEPGWRAAVISGALLGLATLVRPVLFYFPLFLVPFLMFSLLWGKRISLLRGAGYALVVGVVFAMMVMPWLARNYSLSGRFQLTAQGGEHLSQYVVPFVWQYSRGIPFIEGMKKVNRDMDLEAERQGENWNTLAPFERSERRAAFAMGILRDEPVSAIAKAWLFGVVKNLFAPAVVDMSYLLAVKRPHFFYTEGTNLIDRGVNFMKGMTGWFAWALLGSLFLMPLARLAQAWGLVVLFREKDKLWTGLLFLGIIGYFLMASGPVGYAKYRIPFEPILIVLLAVSIKRIASSFSAARD